MSLSDELAALRGGAAAGRVTRDVVRVSGADTVTYLQGQLSQDIPALAIGSSAPTFVLEPQGKVAAWMRVTRVADDVVLLDTDTGWGDVVIERLSRFKLRTAVDLELLPWSMVSVRGPAASEPDAPVDGVIVAVAATSSTPGGWDVLGSAPAVPAGVDEVSSNALEVLRIDAGIPRMGSEVDSSTIPAETGMVDASVSFTKGCYTGQELVARIDSRGGRAPRRVVHLRLPDEDVAVGATLVHAGAEVGRITSVAPDGTGGSVALGLLARSVDTPCELSVEGAAVHAVEIVEVGPGS